jgi:hypothetical protein
VLCHAVLWHDCCVRAVQKLLAEVQIDWMGWTRALLLGPRSDRRVAQALRAAVDRLLPDVQRLRAVTAAVPVPVGSPPMGTVPGAAVVGESTRCLLSALLDSALCDVHGGHGRALANSSSGSSSDDGKSAATAAAHEVEWTCSSDDTLACAAAFLAGWTAVPNANLTVSCSTTAGAAVDAAASAAEEDDEPAAAAAPVKGKGAKAKGKAAAKPPALKRAATVAAAPASSAAPSLERSLTGSVLGATRQIVSARRNAAWPTIDLLADADAFSRFSALIAALRSAIDSLKALIGTAAADQGSGERPARARAPVLLVLRHTLQRVPFESMPVVQAQGQALCRVVNWPFLRLLRHRQRALCSAGSASTTPVLSVRYLIDPVNACAPFAKSLSTAMGLDSKAISGMDVSGLCAPSSSAGPASSPCAVPSALTDEWFERALCGSALFVYGGHSATQQFFSERAVRRLALRVRTTALYFGTHTPLLSISLSPLPSHTTPTAVCVCGCDAMQCAGCSSAFGNFEFTGEYEFLGVSVSHLSGGATGIAANLWTVTDTGMTAFADRLLAPLFKSTAAAAASTAPALPLARALALPDDMRSARAHCDFRFINGAAPVFFGLPQSLAAATIPAPVR